MRDLTKETDRLFKEKLAKNGELEMAKMLWLYITYERLKLYLTVNSCADFPSLYITYERLKLGIF